MRFLKAAWAWWKEWRPLFIWPVAWFLMISGIAHGLFVQDYAHGTFLFVLGYALDRDATKIAKAYLDKEDRERALPNRR